MSNALSRDIATGTDRRHRVHRTFGRARTWLAGHSYLLFVYRLVVALLGTLVLVVGIILIPLPGPGWLIVFLGLAVLGSEFASARRVGAFLKRIVTRGLAWWRARRDRRLASSV
jgi:uncharacterized protein (TIGR02611 family)